MSTPTPSVLTEGWMESGDAEAIHGNKRIQHKRRERMDMIHLTRTPFSPYRHIKK
jgi:hypothetical protein